MSTPQIVWLVVGITTAAMLLAVLLGLAKQVGRLGKAVLDFKMEVRPTLDELREESERAQRHADELSRKGQELRKTRA